MSVRGASETTTEAEFLAGIRAFLAAELTADLREAGRATVGTHSEIGACRRWHARLHARGWIAPAWPREHGGTGWTPRQRLLFDRECASHDAPILFAGGLRNVGPLLIARGTPAQRARYLPRILDGSDLWCQGYSEAGAGSDLAALRTAARRSGDSYVVHGSKLWTTGADIANRMFALVRTSTRDRPQQGITFLLVDMHSPGIRVRPITTLAGEAEFNEVLFEDVRVPVEDRVGDEDDGWSVAKTLMYFARASNTTCSLLIRSLRRVEALRATVDPGTWTAMAPALAEVRRRLDAVEGLEYALADVSVDALEARASVLKVLATELHQRITEIGFELAGLPALERRDPALDTPGSLASARYLATRAASIYSGTNEIHRNIVARGVLGLR